MINLPLRLTLADIQNALGSISLVGRIPDEFRMNEITWKSKLKPLIATSERFHSIISTENIYSSFMGMKIILDSKVEDGEVEVRDTNGNMIELVKL